MIFLMSDFIIKPQPQTYPIAQSDVTNCYSHTPTPNTKIQNWENEYFENLAF